MCLCVFKTIFSLLRHTLWLAVREIENDGDANVRWHTKCTFFIRFNCLCGTSHILLSDLHVGRLSRLPQLHWRSWNLCTSLATGSLVGIFLLLVSIFSSGSEKKIWEKINRICSRILIPYAIRPLLLSHLWNGTGCRRDSNEWQMTSKSYNWFDCFQIVVRQFHRASTVRVIDGSAGTFQVPTNDHKMGEIVKSCMKWTTCKRLHNKL